MKRTQIVPVLQASVVSDMHSIYLNWITGMNLGIEIFTGDDVMDGDKFAVKLNLLIFSITYVLSD